jgi:RNA recognition motif-containing protein
MGKKLYVGNLSYETTESEIRDLFAEIGTVTSVSLVTDRETGASKGFAFVEMETDELAEQARQTLNGRMVNHRAIRVDEARPPSDRGGGPRRSAGGGGGYRSGGGGGYGGGGGDYGDRGGGYGGVVSAVAGWRCAAAARRSAATATATITSANLEMMGRGPAPSAALGRCPCGASPSPL